MPECLCGGQTNSLYVTRIQGIRLTLVVVGSKHLFLVIYLIDLTCFSVFIWPVREQKNGRATYKKAAEAVHMGNDADLDQLKHYCITLNFRADMADWIC